MKNTEKNRNSWISLIVILAVSIITLFLPFVVVGSAAGSLFGTLAGQITTLSTSLGLSGAGALAALLPAIAPSATIGLNGVQLALGGGAAFSFLGDFSPLIPTRLLFLIALICIVLMAPSILNLTSLFMALFRKTKNSAITVVVLQSVGFVLHALITAAIARGVSVVNNVAVLSFGFGAALAVAANLAGVVLAAIWAAGITRETPVKVSASEKNGALACLAGEYAGSIIPLRRGEELMIGRDGAYCNVVLTGDKISRKHCMICCNADTGRYLVTDLSSNGTYVKGGARLIKNQPTELSAGTVLILGNEDTLFRLQ